MDIEDLVKLAFLLDLYCESKGFTERQAISTIRNNIETDIRNFDDGE